MNFYKFSVTQLWILFGTLIVTFAFEKRTLKVNINDECTFEGLNCTTWTNISIIHIRSDSFNDSLHFVWSFNGSPSMLLAKTSISTSINIDWDRFFRNEVPYINFNGVQPTYTFAYTLNKVWVYDDVEDDVRLDKVNQKLVRGYDTKHFKWEREDFSSILNSEDVELSFKSNNYLDRLIGANGTFSVTIRAREIGGYSNILPYMLHNCNSEQVDIDFSQVEMDYPNKNPNHTRIAFTFTLVQGNEQGSSEVNEDGMRLERLQTLDDEYTPGVFNIYNFKTSVYNFNDENYLQWKPISYVNNVRDITDSVDVTVYDLQRSLNYSTEDNTLNSSMLLGYYGSELESLELSSFNISFGTRKDGFYSGTPHVSWTYVTGYGPPPKDFVSSFVVLIVGIGFLIPIIIILISVIYIACKKNSRESDEALLIR